ncbi:PREDICTED: proton-coupled amino acid transporter 3 [Fragaria vesca subsp. vesca]|uniref:proton-coupled amino acid transporter 3 n=1 Tax=Fragaria vesca subsp. vesca TaxID=101020 RepID=UPI0002C33E1C|nr:PREDICTED: proton-coupled amino acid transporter 3 [Fragaria vesca subsp. vesca]XP_011467157.1 PREDICTED: proton-coupled amino acid transporter 3 [Fragaria vesca subsp. vesca]
MAGGKQSAAGVPLLEKAVGASRGQTLGNIIVSVVGTGVLGLPYAMRIAGWLAGSLGVIVTGISTYYCMLLLVQCREKYASEEDSVVKKSYGDLGYECMGRKGRILTESLILIAQCGGSVAYLVFVGQNVSSMFNGHGISVNSCIFLLVPVEIGLSWIGSLSALAPFSIFAAICNLLAMAIVVKEDIQQAVEGEFSFRDRTAITSNIGGLPFAGGVAVFCFEGFGMTLALEASMKDKTQFPKLLAQAFTGISIVYALFGFFGYMAYGDQTREIISLNLPQNWSSIAVQIGLCLGLVFTFPIMLHPINEIIEGNITKDSSTRLGKLGIYMSRAMVVMVLAIFASCVPGFAVFASLVGSTVCALISFVLPATFHLKLFGSSLQFWQKALDFFILLCGLLFAVYGTYNAIVGV